MRRAWLLPAALLAGCQAPGEDAGVVLYDPGYGVEILLGNADGITAPDGLRWHDGALYIADEGGSAIRRWDGTAVTTLADRRAGIASPEDLVVDGAGRIWFTDDTTGGLWQVTPQGAQRVAGSQAIAESEGIALLPDGTIWVGDGASGRVTAFAPGGGGTAAAVPLPGAPLDKPESIARTADGAMWLADNRADRLLRIGPDARARDWPLPADVSPETIAAEADRLWITDSHNGRLYRLGPDGRVQTVAAFLADYANINGVAVDPAGRVYVAVQSDLAGGRGVILRLVPQAAEGRAP